MPEAFAILAVLIIALGAYMVAKIKLPHPDSPEAAWDVAGLRARMAWLDHRLAKARSEQWDAAMLTRIQAEHTATDHRLAKALIAKNET